MRGIELPAGTEDKKNSGGFYVANGAVFTQITRQGTGICLRHFWERR